MYIFDKPIYEGVAGIRPSYDGDHIGYLFDLSGVYFSDESEYTVIVNGNRTISGCTATTKDDGTLQTLYLPNENNLSYWDAGKTWRFYPESSDPLKYNSIEIIERAEKYTAKSYIFNGMSSSYDERGGIYLYFNSFGRNDFQAGTEYHIEINGRESVFSIETITDSYSDSGHTISFDDSRTNMFIRFNASSAYLYAGTQDGYLWKNYDVSIWEESTVNAVNVGGDVVIDISDTTAEEESVMKGKIFYLSDGRPAIGTHEDAEPDYELPTIDVSAGGLITASANGKSNTKQLSTQAGKTVTPTKNQQIVVDTSKFTTGAVIVDKIPTEYVIPAGEIEITENGTHKINGLASVFVNVPTGDISLPDGIAAFDYGEITVSSAFSTTRQTFSHKLGVIPDLMIVWSPQNIATTYSMLAAIRGNQFGWRSSAYNSHYAYHGNSTTTVTWANNNNTTYGICNMTATTFQLSSHSTSYYWRAGTYKYIAIKFK